MFIVISVSILWIALLAGIWLWIGRTLGRSTTSGRSTGLITCAGCALILPAVLLLAAPSTAQEAEIRQVTLEDAHRLFRQNNLELLIARARADEAVALIQDAAAYPNPSATVTHEPVSDGDVDYSESYFNLSQRIEWPGARAARIDAASQFAEVAAAELTSDSLRLSFDVSRVFTQAVAAVERVRVLREVTEYFRDADRAGQAMLEEGETSGYHLRRLRVERARYENRLSRALLAKEAARRRLELLILPEADPSVRLEPVPEPGQVPRDIALESVLDRALAQRAELASARAAIEAASARERLARRKKRPEPLVTAGYKRQSDGFNGLFLSLGAPIPVFDRNRGVVAAAEAQLYAAETRYMLVERSIAADVRRSFDTYNSLVGRDDLIATDLLADIDALLTAARTAYSEGEMTLVELLDAAEAYRDARISTLELTTDLRIAYYDLVRAAGGSISN